MLNDSLSNQSTNKKYTALQEDIDKIYAIIAGYQSSFATTKLTSDTADIDNADINELTTDKTTASVVNADYVKAGQITSDTASLGDVTAKSLNLLNNDIEAAISNAIIEKATIDDLTVNKTVDFTKAIVEALNALRIDSQEINATQTYYLSSKELAALVGTVAYIADGFTGLNIVTDQRPTWKSNQIALLSDIDGLSFKGILSSKDDVPATASNGDFYYIHGGELAIYSNSQWDYDALTLYDAYRTSSDQDAIDKGLQESINSITTDYNDKINTLTTTVNDLSTTVADNQTTNEATHTSLKSSIDTNTTNIAANKTSIDTLTETKADKAPADGSLYGMKDNEWSKVDTSSIYLNKESAKSTITNSDDSGLSATGSFTVDTADQSSDLKSVVNRQYIRDNLSLSRTSSSSSVYYKEVLEAVDSIEPNLDGSSAVAYKGTEANTNQRCRTKDYYIVWEQDYPNYGGATETAGSLVWHKSDGTYGTVKKARVGRAYRTLVNGAIASHCYTSVVLGSFSPTTYEAYPALVNYWYLVLPNMGLIQIFDGSELVDEMTITDGFFNTYYDLHAKMLKGKPEILLYCHYCPKAIILGIDGDGTLDPTNHIEITALPGLPMMNNVASTEDGWWFISRTANAQNIVIKIGDTGTSSAYVMQGSDGTTVAGTNVYTCPRAFIERDNGDAAFLVNAIYGDATAATTGIVYIAGNSTSSMPIKYIDIGTLYTRSGTTASSTPFDEALYEAGNYLIFIPSIKSEFVSDALNAAYTMTQTAPVATINYWVEVNVESEQVQTNSYPWTLSAARDYYGNKAIYTKGGYLWIWPSNAGFTTTSAIVVAPTGSYQTVAINSQTAYTWNAEKSNGYYNGSSWTQAYRKVSRYYTVNSDGIGMIVSQDASAVCVFYGNGNNIVYTYSTPAATSEGSGDPRLSYTAGAAERPIGYTAATANTASPIVSVGSAMLIGQSYENAIYHPYYVVPSMVLKYDETQRPIRYYTSMNYFDEAANRAKTVEQSAYCGQQLSHDNDIDGRYDDGRATNMSVLASNADQATTGSWGRMLRFVWELNDATDTIYLKDGDYVVSNA